MYNKKEKNEKNLLLSIALRSFQVLLRRAINRSLGLVPASNVQGIYDRLVLYFFFFSFTNLVDKMFEVDDNGFGRGRGNRASSFSTSDV